MLIAAAGHHHHDDWFADEVWLPVWVVLAALCIVGSVIWYFANPDRKDAGMEALITVFMGTLSACFWPLLLGGGLVAGFIWSLYRLRRRLYPRLKIPDTDLRVRHPLPEGLVEDADGPGVETQY